MEKNVPEINAHRMSFNDNLTPDAIDKEGNWFTRKQNFSGLV